MLSREKFAKIVLLVVEEWSENRIITLLAFLSTLYSSWVNTACIVDHFSHGYGEEYCSQFGEVRALVLTFS